MRIGVMLAAAMLAMPGTALAQMTPEQAAVVAGDPPAAPQPLGLADVPAAAGPARALFNGRDLNDWEQWLGYADPALTLTSPAVSPIGNPPDAPRMFGVVSEDGAPAIRVDGRLWGALVHEADLADYHLSLEFKWGDQVWAPRIDQPKNNGLLFHSHGEHGAAFGTWMRSVEFEIMRGSTGMAVPVGKAIRARVPVGQDMAIRYPHRRFRLGGREIELADVTPAWNVEASVDAEKPVGQWNRIDLYVLGDGAVYLVNGVPVMEIKGIAELDANGALVPLTHGRIQLQSEGAEIFFRDIRVEPIKSLPRVVVAR
jgi:hypothetical protein